MIRRLYAWTLKWAGHEHALWALFIISFAESSFFPVPPDLLLIPMVLARPKEGLKIALVCTIASALGGAFGYFLGYYFWGMVGDPIIHFYGAEAKYEKVVALFHQYDAWIVGIAGFSPIPYKLFTLTAGALQSDFTVFLVVSILSRGARFFLVTGLLMWGGERLRGFLEAHLEKLTVAISVLLVLGFVVIKWL